MGCKEARINKFMESENVTFQNDVGKHQCCCSKGETKAHEEQNLSPGLFLFLLGFFLGGGVLL